MCACTKECVRFSIEFARKKRGNLEIIIATAIKVINLDFIFISDQPSYLSIELDNKDRDVTLKSVELLDEDDNHLKELPLKIEDDIQQFYATVPFNPPLQTFKIAVSCLFIKKNNRENAVPAIQIFVFLDFCILISRYMDIHRPAKRSPGFHPPL